MEEGEREEERGEREEGRGKREESSTTLLLYYSTTLL